MKKSGILIAIGSICLLVVAVYLLVSLTFRVHFLESFSQAQGYQTKAEFVEEYGQPVYELTDTDLSYMQKLGPIQDEAFLRGKTLCLFGWTLPPHRFIKVYFDNDTHKVICITWAGM